MMVVHKLNIYDCSLEYLMRLMGSRLWGLLLGKNLGRLLSLIGCLLKTRSYRPSSRFYHLVLTLLGLIRLFDMKALLTKYRLHYETLELLQLSMLDYNYHLLNIFCHFWQDERPDKYH